MAKRISAAKRRFRRRVKKISIFLTVLVLLTALCIAACDYFDVLDKIGIGSEETPPTFNGESGEITAHIIDVGQGDAILVKTPSGNMLIDSGDLGSKPRQQLTDYLNAQNVTSFEYVVFTHTDADHIGSGDYIINNYQVKNVIMPDYVATTQVYTRLMNAIQNKNVNLILIGENKDKCEQIGYRFNLGPITNTVMGPTKDFKDANEMSVVIKSVYGETSILFTGDAEHKSEEAMLDIYKGAELDCDILKVGHHGSSTSSTPEFLTAVSPTVALISCGQGNKFGHPHQETIDKFEDREFTTYRTDKNGSIVIKTNGIDYSVTTEK